MEGRVALASWEDQGGSWRSWYLKWVVKDIQDFQRQKYIVAYFIRGNCGHWHKDRIIWKKLSRAEGYGTCELCHRKAGWKSELRPDAAWNKSQQGWHTCRTLPCTTLGTLYMCVLAYCLNPHKGKISMREGPWQTHLPLPPKAYFRAWLLVKVFSKYLLSEQVNEWINKRKCKASNTVDSTK